MELFEHEAFVNKSLPEGTAMGKLSHLDRSTAFKNKILFFKKKPQPLQVMFLVKTSWSPECMFLTSSTGCFSPQYNSEGHRGRYCLQVFARTSLTPPHPSKHLACPIASESQVVKLQLSPHSHSVASPHFLPCVSSW